VQRKDQPSQHLTLTQLYKWEPAPLKYQSSCCSLKKGATLFRLQLALLLIIQASILAKNFLELDTQTN